MVKLEHIGKMASEVNPEDLVGLALKYGNNYMGEVTGNDPENERICQSSGKIDYSCLNEFEIVGV